MTKQQQTNQKLLLQELSNTKKLWSVKELCRHTQGIFYQLRAHNTDAKKSIVRQEDLLEKISIVDDDNAAFCQKIAQQRIANIRFHSQTVQQDDLFVALQTSTRDGHAFLENAFHRGAICALIKTPLTPCCLNALEQLALKNPTNKPCWLIGVPCPQKALEQLGHAARLAHKGCRVGITGSVGKTSSKSMLTFVLRALNLKVHTSFGNYNNYLGVPLTLARMPPETAVGIFEMGMNAAGELKDLSAQVTPHIGLVTNIGTAHIGAFSEGAKGIAHAKAEMLEGLTSGGIAVVHRDTPFYAILADAAAKTNSTVLSFGNHLDAHFCLKNTAVTSFGTHITFRHNILNKNFSFQIPWVGKHWGNVCLGVLGVVEGLHQKKQFLNASLETVVMQTMTAMEALPPVPEGRGNIMNIPWHKGHITMIDGTYNASLESVESSITILADLHAQKGNGRKIAVLGDIHETGDSVTTIHQKIACLCDQYIDYVILVGPHMALHTWPALHNKENALHCTTAALALKQLHHILRPDDCLLLKGSNALGLNVIPLALVPNHNT